MRTYEVVFDEKNDKGVYALSCVENPAMEDMWVALEEHPKEIQFSAVDDEKRLLLGAALIPNKKVYRNIDGEEFYITFPESTIEACAHSFLKNGFQNNSSVNHEVKLEGVSVVQSWIVEDPEKDKSTALGKTYEKGTWVTMMKVENEEAWEAAKKGELNGFSIDGLFSLKEVNLNKNEMVDKSNLKDNILTALKEFFIKEEDKKAEVKMGQLKLSDGKSIVEFEGDAPEVGKPVFGLSEDKEEKFPMPEGSHELESGDMLHVDSNGLVAETPIEEPKVEVKEEAKNDVEESAIEMAKIFKSEMAKMEKSFEDRFSKMEQGFKTQLEAEKKKNQELEAKLEKEPAADKIVKTVLKVAEPKNAKQRLLNVALEARNRN
ncbi:XkdF-like putative serine protease domain-containing protein [Flagellimonas sp. CMM7]|uniref:XkdF-like putative serine protease domain-containing protein n=1 Tax=Flagellimonas sp. CMM7 TaxID=2654676 RepID=UPI0013D123A2|nr:XkdF-like putative serine protease domain-containing protein [Flagellimonas sp. CMM7]UII80003.1 XkdF-like putative serine protease domain-containing protein [Flagellimonas sp. CMM7]